MITSRQRGFGLVFAAITAVGPLWAAEQAAKNTPPPTVDVTSIVHDQDTSGNPLAFQSDDFGTQGYASYTTTGGVTSVVGNAGGWSLWLFSQSLRTVHLTFTTADGSAPIPQNGYYWENVQIYSQCYDPSGNTINFLTLTAGTSAIRCRFAFDFTDQGTKYKLEMGEFQISSGPVTGVAVVTCNSSSGGSCNSWTIAPNTTAPLPTIANLYEYGHKGLVFLGQYILTFRIDVTMP